MNKSSKVAELLEKPGKRYSSLVARVRERERFTAKILADLPPEFRKHCHILRYEAGTLQIAADSNGWASRLRYSERLLLERIRKIPGLEGLRELRVRVIPQQQPRNNGKPPQLSSQVANHLEKVAENTNDPELSAALLRLAQRSKR